MLISFKGLLKGLRGKKFSKFTNKLSHFYQQTLLIKKPVNLLKTVDCYVRIKHKVTESISWLRKVQAADAFVRKRSNCFEHTDIGNVILLLSPGDYCMITENLIGG